MAPLYDILSTYPIHGRGPNHLDPHKARLSMAVRRGHARYLLHDIHRWHWLSMAKKAGLGDAGKMIDEFIERVPEAIEHVSGCLPEGFPAAVFDAVGGGMLQASTRLANEPDKSG